MSDGTDWKNYEGKPILVYVDTTSTYTELVLYKYDPNVDTPFICLLPGSTRLYLGRYAQLLKEDAEFLTECD